MTTRRGFLMTAALLPLAPQIANVGMERSLDEFPHLDEHGTPTPAPRYLDRQFEDWFRAFLDARRLDETSVPCEALPYFGESLVQPALEVIGDVEGWKQIKLVACIAQTGKTAVPALRVLLEHPSWRVRVAACRGLVRALDNLDNVSPIMGQAMAEVLHMSEGLNREGWRQALARLEAAERHADASLLAGPEIITAVIARSGDTDRRVRIAAVRALGELNCEKRLNANVFHAVVSGLADPEPGVRGTASASLFNLMVADRLPMPRDGDVRTMARSLSDPTPYVATTMKEVLDALPGGPYVPDVMPVMTDQEVDGGNIRHVRFDLGTAKRGGAVTPSPEAIRSLERRLAAPSAEDRTSALKELGGIGESGSALEDAINVALSDPDIAVRLAAADALGGIRSISLGAAWGLRARLQDTCLQVAARAQLSLRTLIVRLSAAPAQT